MTNEELKEIEQRVGFSLPSYYKLTILGYPFSEDKFTTPRLLPNNLKTLVKLNSRTPPIEGITRIFFVGGDPDFQLYFFDAALSDSPVYTFNLKTRKHSIKARNWTEYLGQIREEMKEVQEEEAFEREGNANTIRQGRKNENWWEKKYPHSYIWSWLSPLFGVLFVYGGIKTIITKQFHYRYWVYHGLIAEVGGIMFLMWAYIMFRGSYWKKRWNPIDIVIGICAGVLSLGFLVLRWIDILR